MFILHVDIYKTQYYVHTICLVFLCIAWASAVYRPQRSVCYFYNLFLHKVD